ncbi:hypothetical protein [Streptomyces sasae]|uniref:hypothetical protein n=1 Tax=Streptomyces sasae TaxID=1266772 RepID=UPI00292CD59F|nr:hypothetical protein [Streptomyces sasae]
MHGLRELAQQRMRPGPVHPGVLAPSQAFPAEDFLSGLAPYGVRWSVEDPG